METGKKSKASDAGAEKTPVLTGGLDLAYSIDSTPPWYICILLGFQHYLTMLGGVIGIPLLIAPAMCIGNNNIVKGEILGSIFFVSGIVTLVQSTVGVRLPVVQGATFSFLAPTFAILSLPQWQCPELTSLQTDNSTSGNTTMTNVPFGNGTEEDGEIWKSRMREIQGAIIASSLFEVVIGAFGLMGIMLRYIGPLTIVPSIALIGISLFEAAYRFAATQWWIAFMTMALITISSQFLRNVEIPYWVYSRKDGGCTRRGYPIFKLFPILLAIMLAWLVCLVLTVAGALPKEKDGWGYQARTDIKLDGIRDAEWIRVPYPCQWGLPTFSTAGVFGMLAGVLAGMVESIGDYYACARISGAPPPPTHAVNRGLFIEGVGCVLAGLVGTGAGTTTYSENIGAIGITKVGSRRVIQFGAVVMICLGVLGKFGAVFITIPDPIIGGVFIIMFGMIAAVGLSNLQYVSMNSSRNLFIVGASLMTGLALPKWMELPENHGAINTGEPIIDQILTVLASTGMFLGGTVGFVLDNTIPGTEAERGLVAWRAHLDDSSKEETAGASSSSSGFAPVSTYNIPLCTGALSRWNCTSYIPICPSFGEFHCCGKRGQRDDVDDGDVEYGAGDHGDMPSPSTSVDTMNTTVSDLTRM